MIRSLPVPVRLSSEAESYITELGMQLEFEQMLEHTLHNVPGLQALEVCVQRPEDLGGDPCVIIEAVREQGNPADDFVANDWSRWQIQTFPPEVCSHFILF